MAQIATGWACPQCKTSRITQMLYQEQMGSPSIFCQSGHRYNDIGDLKAMNPDKLPVPIRHTLQEGYEKVDMSIPTDLKVELLKKFGSPERLSATLAGVLQGLSQPRAFLINDEDVENVVKLTGRELRSARELVGLFWEQNETIKQLRDNAPVNGAAKTPMLPPGSIAVDMGSHLSKLAGLAKFRNETVEQVAENAIKLALDNGCA